MDQRGDKGGDDLVASERECDGERGSIEEVGGEEVSGVGSEAWVDATSSTLSISISGRQRGGASVSKVRDLHSWTAGEEYIKKKRTEGMGNNTHNNTSLRTC